MGVFGNGEEVLGRVPRQKLFQARNDPDQLGCPAAVAAQQGSHKTSARR